MPSWLNSLALLISLILLHTRNKRLKEEERKRMVILSRLKDKDSWIRGGQQDEKV